MNSQQYSYDASKPPATIISELKTDTKKGLSEEEALARLAIYGKNSLKEEKHGLLTKLLSYFWGPIPWMIEVAVILSAIVGRWEDFFIILTMLFINAGVGFWQEYKADNAIQLLKQKLALKAMAVRSGKWHEIPAELLVPGDIISVKLGNIIPADIVLLEGEYLSVDQSALTGESLPVDKKVGDSVYSGSIAKQGDMKAIVVATGMKTYFGKTAQLVQTAQTRSHFQQAILKIGNFLIVMTLFLAALIILVALFRHDSLKDTVIFALVLTIAAIPVALPAVLSVTMAIGAEALARMHAIVSRLVAIEEMAGMDILCTDKTGTLTKNELTVGEPVIIAAKDERELMIAAVLTGQESGSLDAIDTAILTKMGGRQMLGDYKISNFHPFDPVRKYADSEIIRGDMKFKVVKGAPQVILDMAAPDEALRSKVMEYVDEFAQKGYRTLGVAQSDDSDKWRFLGLIPLFDPPRDDSAATIEEIKGLGVRFKMLTGDHISIAKQIAGKLGLGQNIVAADKVLGNKITYQDIEQVEQADGFAQVLPEHKFEIVKIIQKEGHITGMTGDGVNDAPALKQADIGIAVSGATDAARAAADLVLTAPGLSVITRAIEESRRIFQRMNSYATYRIAETIRVLVFMTLSIVIFNFYPVTALMIVLIALLNDFPIMMIAYDNAFVSKRPLRWNMRRLLIMAVVLGLLGVISSFGLFWFAQEYLKLPKDMIQTLIFLKLLVAGHLTIYLTRNTGFIWQKPFPSWKLFVATEATQIIGTLVAVYGWLVTPIGWGLALFVWGYALFWFLCGSLIKVMTYKLINNKQK